jgi:hypothetical protein
MRADDQFRWIHPRHRSTRMAAILVLLDRPNPLPTLDDFPRLRLGL